MSPPSFSKIRIFKHGDIKLRSGDSPRLRLLSFMCQGPSADGAVQFLEKLEFSRPRDIEPRSGVGVPDISYCHSFLPYANGTAHFL